jgi:hypothetical protein
MFKTVSEHRKRGRRQAIAIAADDDGDVLQA